MSESEREILVRIVDQARSIRARRPNRGYALRAVPLALTPILDMLTDDDKKIIVNSWRLVVPIAPTAADLFYRRLFELKPEYRSLFPGDMDKQKQKLIRMLQFIVKSMDWMSDQWRDEVAPEDDLCLVVLAMGRRHDQLYKIPEDSYEPVGESLMWTLDQGLGDAFTDEVEASWRRLYGVVSTTMKMGARAGKVSMELRRHG